MFTAFTKSLSVKLLCESRAGISWQRKFFQIVLWILLFLRFQPDWVMPLDGRETLASILWHREPDLRTHSSVVVGEAVVG
jgi:hypothetical protein